MNTKLRTFPKQCHLAFSGGMDSSFALYFLKQVKGRVLSCIHINHGTKDAQNYENFCVNICNSYNIKIDLYYYDKSKPMKEAAWHDFRYNIFSSYGEDVVVCHHKDDNLENRLLFGKTMSTRNGNIIRPFLDFSKKNIKDYVKYYNIPYIEDLTNFDENFTKRNKLRRIIREMKEMGCPLDSLLK